MAAGDRPQPQAVSLSVEDIRNDIERRSARLSVEAEAKTLELRLGKSCRKVLGELLEQISPVDFRSLAGLEEGDKLTRKTTVVLAVDKIISVATANSWRICVKNGFIYLYNGSYWQPLGEDDFKSFLTRAALKMGVPQLEAKYHLFKDELYKQFLSEANMETPERQAGVTLINLQNGTFEITQAEQNLREFRSSDFLKYRLSFDYDPQAECPVFDRYLNRVLPDEGSRRALAEYVGYIFTSGLKLEKAAILYGSGANGKSVFFDIVSALVGPENICSYSLQNLTKYDSYQRAELQNKLLNYATEINGRLEASTFKQLVSGEPVEARQIYGRPFTMTDYGKLMFNCNELPKDVEHTEAFFRRFLIIPFSETIPEDERDPHLSEKIIMGELSGVFNWALSGLRRLLEQGCFTQSDALRRQLDEFRKESDSVAMFIDDEWYMPSEEAGVTLSGLHAEYRTYCDLNGYRCCSLRTFAKRLDVLGFRSGRNRLGKVVFVRKDDGISG